MISLQIEYTDRPLPVILHAGETFVTKHGLLFTDKAAVVMDTLMNGNYDLLVIDLREPLMIYQQSEIRKFGKHLDAVVQFYREEERDLTVQLYLPFPVALPSIHGDGNPLIPLIPRAGFMANLSLFDRVTCGNQDLTDAIRDQTQVYMQITDFFTSPLDFIRHVGLRQPITRVVCAEVVQYSLMDLYNNIWRFDVPKVMLPADPEKHQSVTRVFEYSQPWGTIVSEVQ